MTSSPTTRPLTILQCLRAPVGGLFRHVCDLVRLQAGAGHRVGVVCDASSGGAMAQAQLAALAPYCALGIHRTAMSRQIGVSDIAATRLITRLVREWGADVLHGHGAKGGAYVRLARGRGSPNGPIRIYTPHGGSLHYSSRSLQGMVFFNLERILLKRTDAIVFESKYSLDIFSEKVGEPGCRAPVIHNGLMAEDFEPVTPRDGAADFVFVGELRQLKGVDTLLKAFAAVRAKHPRVRLLAVGGGPDEENFRRLAGELGIAGAVEFPGPRPAREAFAGGRVLVVPSRKESFPYIVLEAIAAGQPLIATNVGGIPEIFGPHAAGLIAPGRPQVLAAAMTGALEGSLDLAARTAALNERARGEFSAEVMAERIGSLYDSLLQHRHAATGGELLEAEESSISA